MHANPGDQNDLDGFWLGPNCGFFSNELFWMNPETSPQTELLLTRLTGHKFLLVFKKQTCPENPICC